MTAVEFVEKNNLPVTLSGGTLKWVMIEFAKLHVEAALKAKVKAMEGYQNNGYDIDEIDAFTRNSYPLENIK